MMQPPIRHVRSYVEQMPLTELESDNELRHKLLGELPGILNWIVEGAKRYLECGLSEPQQVKEATRALRLSCDDLGRWLSERVVDEPGDRTQSSILHANYLKWAQQEGIPIPMSPVAFSKALTARGYEKLPKSNGNMFWSSVRLLDDGDRLNEQPNHFGDSIDDGAAPGSSLVTDQERKPSPNTTTRLPSGQYVL